MHKAKDQHTYQKINRDGLEKIKRKIYIEKLEGQLF